jgi:hypothetical protein
MICLFGLSLAELQLFASQSYNTSYLELAESYFKLNWPRTPTELKTRTETGFIWNLLYNLRTDHTENISTSIVETCVLSYCIATVATLTIVNPLLLHYPATTSKHSFFFCCMPLKVSMSQTVTAWGKHATICFFFSCISYQCKGLPVYSCSEHCILSFLLDLIFVCQWIPQRVGHQFLQLTLNSMW